MLKVLLIEDDEVDAEMITKTLSSCYFYGEPHKNHAEVFHTNYFEKGLELLHRDQKIDIVLLDLNLPDGQGTELVHTLNQKYQEVPIVVLTGQEYSDELELKLVLEGAQDYLPKNQVNPTTLKRSIQYSITRSQLNKQIKAQSTELQFRNDELITFTYIASHDLRSPLVNLKGFASELEQSIQNIKENLKEAIPHMEESAQKALSKELDDKIPKAINFISCSADKIDRLTEAILHLARLGKCEMHFEKISTQNLVEQCIQTLYHQLEKNHSSITLDDLPDIVGDKNSIEQIFGNLLDNAVKYLDPTRPGKIHISSNQTLTHTIFSIKDNGRGISDKEKHKVFEIFRRGGNVMEIPGEGMGMPFVRTMVKRHKGDIWFDSKENIGTTFSFSISKHLNNHC